MGVGVVLGKGVGLSETTGVSETKYVGVVTGVFSGGAFLDAIKIAPATISAAAIARGSGILGPADSEPMGFCLICARSFCSSLESHSGSWNSFCFISSNIK